MKTTVSQNLSKRIFELSRLLICTALAIFLVQVEVSFASNAIERTLLLEPVDSGWYDREAGTVIHQPDNTNYIVGHSYVENYNEFRNFFVFDFSAIDPQVVSATFLSELTYYGAAISLGEVGTWTLYDVTTDIPSLRSGSNAHATFEDLGSGTEFGKLEYTRDDRSGTVSVEFNEAAINAINAADGLWAFGGAVTDLQGPLQYDLLFNGGDVDTFPRLLIEIPEPSGCTLIVLAFLLQPRRPTKRMVWQ